MRIIVVSGLSGAGKSVVLHALEDLGHYCIDNLPASMLEPFVAHALRLQSERTLNNVAIGIDARDSAIGLSRIPETIDQLRRSGLRCEMLFVLAEEAELLRRYGETKRRHPLSRQGTTLLEAIQQEKTLLEPLLQATDLTIDTTHMGVHELRELVVQRIDQRRSAALSVTLVSFGFKHGVPGDCDFIFDARTLPNPYWSIALRPLSGLDEPVIEYLDSQPAAAALLKELEDFIARRIAEHQAAHRRYLTIGIGCTGGQHRSVYLVEQLAQRLRDRCPTLEHRHQSLSRYAVPTLTRSSPSAPA
jgi:UPF0042 nucleotide-binding protein